MFIVQRYDWRDVGGDMPFDAVVKTTMVFENEDYCKLMFRMLKGIDIQQFAETLKSVDVVSKFKAPMMTVNDTRKTKRRERHG